MFECKIIASFKGSDGVIRHKGSKNYLCSEKEAKKLAAARCVMILGGVNNPSNTKTDPYLSQLEGLKESLAGYEDLEVKEIIEAFTSGKISVEQAEKLALELSEKRIAESQPQETEQPEQAEQIEQTEQPQETEQPEQAEQPEPEHWGQLEESEQPQKPEQIEEAPTKQRGRGRPRSERG
jgi:hypothetical protein